MKPVRDLLKHSSIYAIGQILTRMASIMLLPLYTHCLSPADYGVTAILDLTTAILALMIGGGMVSAVTRFHFDQDDELHHDRVWWTGFACIGGTALLVLLPFWFGRQMLSDLTLGADYADGPWFYTLTLATTWAFTIGHIADTYLRVQKWSGLFVLISLARLLLNIGLNVYLLVGLQMGVQGLLLGNLTATLLHTGALMVVFWRSRGGFQFDSGMARQLFRFSMPLVVMALMCMLMHEADRYILRAIVSMEEVGVYSLAHKIGFAVNTLCLMPFISIWHVAVYDIERMDKANDVFRKVFGWFTSGLGILLLGASLTVHQVLPLLTPDSYGDAIDLVAVILLGFYFFGLQIQFEVPAMLSKKTGLLVPGSIVGVVVNVAMNFLLIPSLGSWGAGWAGVLTYLAYSITVLLFCRQVRRIDYPWISSGLVLLGLCGTYVGLRYGVFPLVGLWSELALSVAACAVWALILFGREELVMKKLAKPLFEMLCTIIVLPAIILYRLQQWMGLETRTFAGWSQLFSLLPGASGVYLRNAFYRASMQRCAAGVWIGFGTLFSGSKTSLGKSVYLGNYCSIGEVTIEDDVLIASHVSIMNGTRQHGTERLDCPIREQPGVQESITIGENSWIGERATIAANVGKHCIIGAGSVVLKPIPDYAVAVGVPARIVRDRREPTNPPQNSSKIGENPDLSPEEGSHQEALHILQTVSSLRTPTE